MKTKQRCTRLPLELDAYIAELAATLSANLGHPVSYNAVLVDLLRRGRQDIEVRRDSRKAAEEERETA